MMTSPDRNIEEHQRTDEDVSDETSSEEETSSSESSEDESESEPVDLRTRLAAFLPELEKANEELKNRPDNLERVEDGEQYIEMNLGLGVLEESKDEPKVHSGESENDALESTSRGRNESEEPSEEPPPKRRKIQEVELT